jgi:hypothetical protein
MQTWIDGNRYFDREQDMAMRARDKQRREHLISIVLESQMGAGKPEKAAAEGEEGSR